MARFTALSFVSRHPPQGCGCGLITCTPFMVAVNPLDPDHLWASLSFPTRLSVVARHLHCYLTVASVLGTNQALDNCL